MPAPTRPTAPFRILERALFRRRIAFLDPRTRGSIALLALLSGGFMFWRVRVPLDGLVRARGAATGVRTVLLVGAALAVLGGVLAGIAHARRLRKGPGGPEWLALPIEPAALERHIAWTSRAFMLWLTVPALALLVASAGLIPALWLAGIAAAIVLLGAGAAHAGCAIAHRMVLPTVESRPGLATIERILVAAAPRDQRRPHAAARWMKAPAWLAVVRKDLLLTSRRPAARAAAIWPVLWWIASLAAWTLHTDPVLRRFVAFACVLLAATTLAEWLIVLIGSDPFPVLRVLPVGLSTVWGARAGWGAAAALVFAISQAAAAAELFPPARELLAVCVGAATLAITVLGVNYGVTLFPRGDVAGRIFGLSLGLAMAASVMIPLIGWVVLLAAVLHSARRLPRWSRLEEA